MTTTPAQDAAILWILLLWIYAMPLLFAWGRRHHQKAAITVVNIFLGWTFIGWVVALAWALSRTGHQCGSNQDHNR